MGGGVNIGVTFGSRWGYNFTVGDLVSIILSNAIYIAGFIMFILFVAGGIGIMMGAGNDNPETAAKGKQAITAAVIGFVIVFSTYWIVQIIEAITNVQIINSGL